MLNEIICAGFGGQGVLTAGKIMVYAAYRKGLQVTWFPSYGNEMRGGSANCNVVISDERIASPYAKNPDTVLALNGPAVEKFEQLVKADGTLFVNSSLVDPERTYRGDIRVLRAPVTELAQKAGNARGANIVMLGQWVKHNGLFSKEDFVACLCAYFEEQGKGKYNEKNVGAFEAGFDYAQAQA
ncbi:MAG: 2-oxoacid:acceptor oxidoreductase family protein [Clostridia bacterium]|nr:2-oxoacid:acceptor oxidoreductase family protein [Clostridia bacterium]